MDSVNVEQITVRGNDNFKNNKPEAEVKDGCFKKWEADAWHCMLEKDFGGITFFSVF